MPKPLPTNVRPMTLDVSSEIFTSEWGRCILDKKYDMTKLITMIKPFVKEWEYQLKQQSKEQNINYVTLCKLLSEDSAESLKMIKCWVSWAESTSTIENELTYLFLERVRRFKYYPTLARPVMVEYVVARDYKLGLKHFIRNVWRQHGRDALLTAEYDVDYDKKISYSYQDPFIFDKDNMSPWHLYLLNLVLSNYNTTERSELTHIHRRNLYIEEKKIWDSIKQRLSSSSVPEEP